jgi:chloride channel protein, CIC family
MKDNYSRLKYVMSDEMVVILFSFLTGILGALAAFMFQGVIAFVHNLFFLGKIHFIYHQTIHTLPDRWGIGIILVPVVGSFIVTWMINRFAAAERGLSVPELMYAIHFKAGVVNPVIAIAKTLASSITIGTGGSVGREGPIIEMGAAISYFMSELVQLSSPHRIILLAAGSAAIISTTFNAPFAGIAFAIEILLVSVNLLSIVAIFIAALTAIYCKYLFIHVTPIFSFMPSFYSSVISWQIIGFFILLGILIGFISIVFIHGVYWLENMFQTFFKNHYLRHALGMSVIGIMMYAFIYYTGNYYIEGIGFATIQDLLMLLIKNPQLLLLLFIGKLIATLFTLGSGGAGGVFSPSLFLGAAFGMLINLLFSQYFPLLTNYSVIFVLAGMAAMLASSTSAIFTAILLTIELTGGHSAVWFILLTTIVAFVTRKMACRNSVYTLKLQKRGIRLNER